MELRQPTCLTSALSNEDVKVGRALLMVNDDGGWNSIDGNVQVFQHLNENFVVIFVDISGGFDYFRFCSCFWVYSFLHSKQNV